MRQKGETGNSFQEDLQRVVLNQTKPLKLLIFPSIRISINRRLESLLHVRLSNESSWYETICRKTDHLFKWINSGRGDGTHERRLKHIIKQPLLILDDFGLKDLSKEHQEDLYEVISERYERTSTIITSNRDFSEWPMVFSNPLMGSAAMDRLIHRAVKIVIEGKSYRLNNFINNHMELYKEWLVWYFIEIRRCIDTNCYEKSCWRQSSCVFFLGIHCHYWWSVKLELYRLFLWRKRLYSLTSSKKILY